MVRTVSFYPRRTRILQTMFKAKSFDLVLSIIKLQDITDEEEQVKLIKKYYNDHKLHPGINEIKEGLRRDYYWPSMVKHISHFINNCVRCHINKYDRCPPKINSISQKHHINLLYLYIILYIPNPANTIFKYHRQILQICPSLCPAHKKQS